MKQLNIYTFYKTDRIIEKYIKSLTALAFVKPDKLLETFNQQINSIGFPNTIRIIYEYFFTNYIGQTAYVRFPPILWNHYQHFSAKYQEPIIQSRGLITPLMDHSALIIIIYIF
jgi:hypothetical protein